MSRTSKVILVAFLCVGLMSLLGFMALGSEPLDGSRAREIFGRYHSDFRELEMKIGDEKEASRIVGRFEKEGIRLAYLSEEQAKFLVTARGLAVSGSSESIVFSKKALQTVPSIKKELSHGNPTIVLRENLGGNWYAEVMR